MRTLCALKRPAKCHPCLKTLCARHVGHQQYSTSTWSLYHGLTRSGRQSSPMDRASLSKPTSLLGKRYISQERVKVSSPFRLTSVKDLPPQDNLSTVELKDLLDDPNIVECWSFNYLHDVKFMMNHFPKETRAMVKVNIVHGFWHEEGIERVALEKQAARWANVKLHIAFMPQKYGSHNSKLLVLFRYDGTAQIIIHTANMIPKDWTTMTNALWISPRLPRYLYGWFEKPPKGDGGKIGTGARFKVDLLNYLRTYNARWNVCKALIESLEETDFSAIRAALVATIPGRLPFEPRTTVGTRWGWPALCNVLEAIPAETNKLTEIVIQSPAIPAIGADDAWLRFLYARLSCSRSNPLADFPYFQRLRYPGQPEPLFRILFPTADEVRLSLDGYESGKSIYTRTMSMRAQKQLEYLKPYLYHWANDAEKGVVTRTVGEKKFSPHSPLLTDKDAGRNRAAPHLRMYIRFRDGTRADRPTIDWALLTSASLSPQSWGGKLNVQQRVELVNWELGVMVWPGLFAPGADDIVDPNMDIEDIAELMRRRQESTEMVATFKTDVPCEEEGGAGDDVEGEKGPLVGLRMPFSLPLMRYRQTEMPWAVERTYTEPDAFGNTWSGLNMQVNGRWTFGDEEDQKAGTKTYH
ncbi:tyrosyl-DNA phosphodiesterase-domain-containing protein [Camillea tinctor]|nr:tyrosyl-DNA phosphodiesterase-domain-containing protein [Camillea tinctor]